MNNFWNGFEKKALRRTMVSDITSRMEPTMVVVYNPMQQRSKIMVKRLDKALQTVSGLKRMRIIALNPMFDKQVMGKLGLQINSVTLYRQGKKIDGISGNLTEMAITKFLQERRGKMA